MKGTICFVLWSLGLFKLATSACSFFVHEACPLTILLIVSAYVRCRSVFACEACQPPPLESPTVSKRAPRKTAVDEADSISAEISDNGHDDDVKPEKRLTRYSYSKRILFEVFFSIRPCNSPQYLGVLHHLSAL